MSGPSAAEEMVVGSKASASKDGGAAGVTWNPAPIKKQPEPSPSPAPSPSDGRKPKKARTQDQKQLNDTQTYFKRVSQGDKQTATAAERSQATEALATLTALDDGDKADFAKKFVDTKKSKNFGWMREYHEKISFQKEVLDHMRESYLTRSFS